MSEIRAMNRALAWKLGITAIIAAALVLLSIAPALVFQFSDDLTDEESRWRFVVTSVPVGLAYVATVLFRWGRETPHRWAVNTSIVKQMAGELCTIADCPQQDEPTTEFRDAAIALFYKKIDSHSREVAFEYWENYYLARGGLQIFGVALCVAVVMLLAFPQSDELFVRIVATGLLGTSVLLFRGLVKNWEQKTSNHARQQVLQIADDLPASLRGAQCENPSCAIAKA